MAKCQAVQTQRCLYLDAWVNPSEPFGTRISTKNLKRLEYHPSHKNLSTPKSSNLPQFSERRMSKKALWASRAVFRITRGGPVPNCLPHDL